MNLIIFQTSFPLDCGIVNLLKIPCMHRNLSSISVNTGTEELLSVILKKMLLIELKRKEELDMETPRKTKCVVCCLPSSQVFFF